MNTFGRPSHHCYAFSLSEFCPRIEKKIYKAIMHISQYDLYGHAHAQDPLARGNEMFNFGRPFLSHHCYVLSLYGSCLGV